VLALHYQGKHASHRGVSFKYEYGMEVKKIFLVLSENEEAVSYTSFLFETPAEQKSLFAFLAFVGLYILLLLLGHEALALLSALLSIFSLIFHSVASISKDKNFFLYPIKSYVAQLNKAIDSEAEIIQKLLEFSSEALCEAKSIAENERDRIKSNISFLSGSIDKVGIFPSFIAFFYAFHKYQASPESGVLAYVVLGVILGMYFGVLLLQRITSWQDNAVFLLNKTLLSKNEENQS